MPQRCGIVSVQTRKRGGGVLMYILRGIIEALQGLIQILREIWRDQRDRNMISGREVVVLVGIVVFLAVAIFFVNVILPSK